MLSGDRICYRLQESSVLLKAISFNSLREDMSADQKCYNHIADRERMGQACRRNLLFLLFHLIQDKFCPVRSAGSREARMTNENSSFEGHESTNAPRTSSPICGSDKMSQPSEEIGHKRLCHPLPTKSDPKRRLCPPKRQISMTDVVAAVFNTNGTNPWMDTGDNAWQLTTATFVGMQSIPGLMVFYGGIVKKKWAVNSAFMAFYAFAAVLVFWVCWGYQMSFGEQWAPFLGKPGAVSTLTIMGQLSQSFIPASKTLSSFPMSTMIYFQAVFAAISLILIAGAFFGRMNFKAWMVFVPLWLTLSYTTVCFSIWGGGWLWQMGVLDYSGGYVIHLSAGTAAYVGAWCIGPRLKQDREDFEPNNIPLAMVGAGLLWLGWNGFNGGDPFNAGPDAGVAVLNTNICTAVSLLTWMVLDIAFFKKPSIIGACQGMITGLVAITPGAGLVAGWGAICMGIASGLIPWISMNVVGKTKLFSHIDDTLGVFHTHAVAGFLGGILTGVFATVEGCAAFALTNPGGGIAGNWHQVALQFYGALYVIAVNLVMTPLILLTIGLVIPLRMSEADLLVGDAACHGEDAYAFYHDGAKEIDMARTASNVSIAGMKGTGMIVLGGSTDALVKGAVVA